MSHDTSRGQRSVTGQQMCEFIAAATFEQTGQRVDPKAIWNMDPHGELWPVAALYEAARAWRETHPPEAQAAVEHRDALEAIVGIYNHAISFEGGKPAGLGAGEAFSMADLARKALGLPGLEGL